MGKWKSRFVKYASVAEDKWDAVRARVRRKLGWNAPLQIIPYRTYGTARRIYIKGRVLENKSLPASAEKDSILSNIVAMYKRFESDEVSGAVLKVSLPNEEHTVTTDKEGYFVMHINPLTPIINDSLYHQVPLRMVSAPIPFTDGLVASAEVMIPPPDAEYGIISDLDDTVIQTSATSLLAMGRTVLLNNARTRLPFAGVAEFYKALQLGRNGKRNNPFFYVSSSPWNLYDLLKEFLDLNLIPHGPLLLRDFGFGNQTLMGGGHQQHKLHEIQQILETYPLLNFVLIGDSGQEDPSIYKEVVRKYPGRILAIYIRDVQLPERKKIAMDISQSLQEEKVEMLIVDNTVLAAEHAAKMGLVYTAAIAVIEEEKKKDKGQTPGKDEGSAL